MTTAAIDIEVTADDIAAYRDRGYWISPKLLTDDQIATGREAIAKLQRGERDGESYGWQRIAPRDMESKALQQWVGAWWVSLGVRELVLSPVVGKAASKIMGVSGVRMWHDQAICKPGLGADADVTADEAKAGNFGWHQDYSYWNYVDTDNLCTVWIALQDTDLSNGGMRTLAGSHKWGFDPKSTIQSQDLDAFKRDCEAMGREWIDEPCIMKAGQASFHHSLTYHGSGPNLTDQPRLSVVAHLIPDGAAYRADGSWNQMTTLMGPHVKTGDKYGDPFFPRLWPVEA